MYSPFFSIINIGKEVIVQMAVEHFYIMIYSQVPNLSEWSFFFKPSYLEIIKTYRNNCKNSTKKTLS